MTDFLLEMTVGTSSGLYGYQEGVFGSVVENDVNGTVLHSFFTNDAENMTVEMHFGAAGDEQLDGLSQITVYMNGADHVFDWSDTSQRYDQVDGTLSDYLIGQNGLSTEIILRDVVAPPQGVPFLGALPVDTFKLGATQVDKVMLGANEVWTGVTILPGYSYFFENGTFVPPVDVPNIDVCVIGGGGGGGAANALGGGSGILSSQTLSNPSSDTLVTVGLGGSGQGPAGGQEDGLPSSFLTLSGAGGIHNSFNGNGEPVVSPCDGVTYYNGEAYSDESVRPGGEASPFADGGDASSASNYNATTGMLGSGGGVAHTLGGLISGSGGDGCVFIHWGGEPPSQFVLNPSFNDNSEWVICPQDGNDCNIISGKAYCSSDFEEANTLEQPLVDLVVGNTYTIFCELDASSKNSQFPISNGVYIMEGLGIPIGQYLASVHPSNELAGKQVFNGTFVATAETMAIKINGAGAGGLGDEGGCTFSYVYMYGYKQAI